MTKIWITRTQPAADESAQVWRDAGFDPLVAPLLEIEPVLHDPLPADAVIIFTSKNGVDHTACGGQRAICVGDAHVSGWHVRGSIIEDLIEAGYSAQRVIAYHSVPSPIWPDVPFSSVVFYSPLAAKTFADIAIDMCIDISKVTAICISQATTDELSALALPSIRIAKRPREDELIMAAK